MFSRLRRLKGTEVPLRVRGASNPPDDDNGIWVKNRFIDEGPAKGRVFIPAGLDDNPYLDHYLSAIGINQRLHQEVLGSYPRHY